MKKVLIACLMMELETKNALEVTGSDAEVIWMEKGLHNKPENLCMVLQKTIEQAEKDFAPDQDVFDVFGKAYVFLGFCFEASRPFPDRHRGNIEKQKAKNELQKKIGEGHQDPLPLFQRGHVDLLGFLFFDDLLVRSLFLHGEYILKAREGKCHNKESSPIDGNTIK